MSTVLATHHALVSLSDAFAVGVGFDFAGAFLLARGLLVPPADFAHRITQSSNTSSWVNVRAAEDRANGVTGVVLLAIGFGVQAIAYVLTIGYGSRQTGGAWASIIAAACAVAAFGLGLAVPWAMRTRWWLIRRFLVELARYDMGGTRHESPGPKRANEVRKDPWAGFNSWRRSICLCQTSLETG